MSDSELVLRENLHFQSDINVLLHEIIRLNSLVAAEKTKHKLEENKWKRENETLKLDIEKWKYQKHFNFRIPYFDCQQEQRNIQRPHIKEAIFMKCRHFL